MNEDHITGQRAGSMTREQRIEAAARAMAAAMGDDFDELPKSKYDWTVNGGKFGGRYRDCNEPMRADYIAMAEDGLTAAIPELMSDPPSHELAPVPYDYGTIALMEANLQAARDAYTKEQT